MLFLTGCAAAGLVLPSGAAFALAGLVAVAGVCRVLCLDLRGDGEVAGR